MTYQEYRERFGKHGFTKREFQIAIMLCEDLSRDEIADKLFISEDTVSTHLYNIFKKLGIKHSHGLVAYLSNNKII